MRNRIYINIITYKHIKTILGILNGFRGKTQSHLRKNLSTRCSLQAITLAITLFGLAIIYMYRGSLLYHYLILN